VFQQRIRPSTPPVKMRLPSFLLNFSPKLLFPERANIYPGCPLKLKAGSKLSLISPPCFESRFFRI